LKYNKKGVIFEYSDLIWALLILLLLILFTILFTTINSSKESATRASDAPRAGDLEGSLVWHSGWLATSYTNFVVTHNDTSAPLGRAIAQGLDKDAITQVMDTLVDATQLDDRYFMVFVLRDHERVYCNGKNIGKVRGQTIGVCGEILDRIQQSDHGLNSLKTSLMNSKNFVSWTVTPGKQETIIGVVVA
jgi:hypothetical protein